jgi:hypothetical protein
VSISLFEVVYIGLKVIRCGGERSGSRGGKRIDTREQPPGRSTALVLHRTTTAANARALP